MYLNIHNFPRLVYRRAEAVVKISVGIEEVLGSPIGDSTKGFLSRILVLIAVLLTLLLFPGTALAVSTVPLSGTLTGDVLVNNLNVQSDNLSLGWNLNSSEMTLSFKELIVDNGTDAFKFTDGQGILLADNTMIDAEGKGRFMLYSNSLSGLSFGGMWDRVNASIKNGILRIDGREIDIFYANISGKNVQTIDPDFSSKAVITLENGSLLLGHARGMVNSTVTGTVNGIPVDQDLTYEGFSGRVDVSAGIKNLTTGLKDRVIFSGSTGKFLMVDAAPGYVLTDPSENVSYNFTVYSEKVKNVSIEVEAPAGWQVIVEDGRIILAPPAGTALGTYETGITAKADGMTASKFVQTEIRMVRNVSAYLFNTSGGTVYTVSFVNNGNVDEILSLNVSGDNGLAALGRDTIELPAGGAGSVSLAFDVDWRIPAGEEFPFEILYRSEDGVINGSASETFVMPAVYGTDVRIDPDEIYGIPGKDIIFDLTAISRSNVNETYIISMDMPENWTANFTKRVILDMGMSTSLEVTISQNASIGSYNMTIEITSPTSNLSTKRMMDIKIVDPITMASWAAKIEAKNTLVMAELSREVVIANYLSDLEAELERLAENTASYREKKSISMTLDMLSLHTRDISVNVSDRFSNLSREIEVDSGQNLVHDLENLSKNLKDLAIELEIIARYVPDLDIENSIPNIRRDFIIDPSQYQLKEDVQESAQKSIEWLQEDAIRWQNAKRCYGCHVQSQAVVGMSIADNNGYEINKTILNQLLDFMKSLQRSNGAMGVTNPPSRWPWESKYYVSITHSAASSFSYYDELISKEHFVNLKAYTDYLMTRQYPDGHWYNEWTEPPIMQGNIMVTASSMVALSRVYAVSNDPKYKTAMDKAESWLRSQAPFTTQDKVYTIIGLKAAGSSDDDPKIQQVVQSLLTQQNLDGGWGEKPSMASNGYATGEAVYALKLAGKTAFDEPVMRGLQWLIHNQNNDGSWDMTNSESKRPSKYAPTMWGVIGLGNVFIVKCTSQETNYVNLTLTNLGSTDSTYALNVTGLPANWNVSIVSNVSLGSKESSNVTIGMTPPENVSDGIYTFSVSVSSLDDPRAKDIVNGVPIVISLCGSAVNLDIQPKSNTVKPTETAIYNITIKNWNNETGNYTINVEGLPEDWYDLSIINISIEGDVSRVNIALESNGATASGGNNPSKLIDGQKAGYTGSSGFSSCTFPCQMTITLPQIYNISKTKTLLYDLDDRFYRYKIETSLDGITWDMAVNKTSGEWRSWQTDEFSTREARYIRVTGTYSSKGTEFRVIETEVYQPSVPPGILNLTVTPVDGAVPGKYVFAVYAVSDSIKDNNNTSTTIAAVDYAELTVESGANAGGVNLKVVPAITYIEKEGKFKVTVENTGRVKTTYNIFVENLPFDWRYDSLKNISLLPGQYKNFYLTLHPGDITPTADDITVRVTSIRDENITDSRNISAIHLGVLGINISLNPTVQKAGQGNPARFNATITNTGKIEDTYNLSIALPVGWNYTLSDSEITLPPFIFNTRNVSVVIMPPIGTQRGEYNFTLLATSKNYSFINMSATGVVNVTLYGVDIRIHPESISSSPLDTPSFNVTVTNTGKNNDTYRLEITGLLGKFGSDEISLIPGESKNITLIIENTTYALQQIYPFEVIVRSVSEPDIMDSVSANITFTGVMNVSVVVVPDIVEVSESENATFTVLVHNSGNIPDEYDLDINVSGAVNVSLETSWVSVPEHLTSIVLLTVSADPGNHTITVIARSGRDQDVYDFDSVTLTVLPRAVSPARLKRDAIARLMAVNSGEEKTDREIDMAIRHINKSLGNVYTGMGHGRRNMMHERKEIPLWLDEYHVDGEYGYRVFGNEKMAVKHLLHACSSQHNGKHKMTTCSRMRGTHDDNSVFVLTCPFNATIINVINNLLLADELLANESIKDATIALADSTATVNTRRWIDMAEKEIDRAHFAITEGRYAKAIDHFGKSWRYAQNAVKYGSE